MPASTTVATEKFVAVVASTLGATTVVAAVAEKKIRVLRVALVASAAVNIKFQSHTAGDITGLFYLAANGGFVLPHADGGWCQTVPGEALDINLSGAVALGGVLVYLEV